MAENPFNIGDIVRLKGSHAHAPDLTVISIAPNGIILTTWFATGENDFKKKEFPADALIKLNR